MNKTKLAVNCNLLTTAGALLSFKVFEKAFLDLRVFLISSSVLSSFLSSLSDYSKDSASVLSADLLMRKLPVLSSTS